MKCSPPREGTKPILNKEYIIAGLCKDCEHWKSHGPRSIWGDCYEIIDNFGIILTGCEIFTTNCDFGCILYKERS